MLLFEFIDFIVFNTHTTLDLLLRYEARANALRASSCLRSENIFFKLFLSDLDEKITFAGYERHPKGNSEQAYLA